MKKNLLDSIDVKSPCNENWDEMFGNDEVRFCSHCAKDVHDLSAITRKKAEELIKNSKGRLCVRYVKNPNGKIVTAPPMLTKITRRATLAASVLATSMTLSTIAYSQGEPIVRKGNLKQTQKDSSKKNELNREFATISGTVKDAAGAIIPGVKINLKNLKTKKSFSIISDENGNYTFSDMEFGNYEMKVEKSGFKTLKFKKLQATENSKIVKDIILLTNGSIEMGIFVINLNPETKENFK